MVKSIAGKYEDIVAMVPLTTISADVIKTWYDRVLEAVTNIGFKVVCSSTDAHLSNRRFFAQMLCGGKMA
jgi:hypothetical protein